MYFSRPIKVMFKRVWAIVTIPHLCAMIDLWIYMGGGQAKTKPEPISSPPHQLGERGIDELYKGSSNSKFNFSLFPFLLCG